MSYSQKQLDALDQACTRLEMTGKPEIAAKVNYLIETGADYKEIWGIAQGTILDTVAAEKDVELNDLIPAPPFDGAGSGKAVWQKFALAVSDIDPEVVDALTRNDLITVLIDRGVIPAPDSSFTYKAPETDDDPAQDSDEEE